MIGVGEVAFVAKKTGKALGFGEKPNYAAMPEDQARKEYNKRTRRRAISMLGATSLVLGGVMGLNGHFRGLERNPPVETESSANAGTAEIIKFDAGYEKHCWTATTVQVNGAGVKDEIKALGIAVADKWTKVDFQIENNLCIKDTKLGFAVNAQTGHVDINVRKDDIYTESSIVYGSVKPSSDQSLSYAFADNTINMMESLPFLEDTGLSKDASKGQDAQAAHALNTSLILGSQLVNEQCMPQTLPLAKKPVEAGLKGLVTLGLEIAKVRHADIDPADVSILADSKPFAQLDSVGETSSVSEAYAKLKKFDDENENFTILPPAEGSCTPSKAVQDLLDGEQTSAVRAGESKGKTNE